MDSDQLEYKNKTNKRNVEINIQYNWPSMVLSPNYKCSWREKHKFQREYKKECFFTTLKFLSDNSILFNKDGYKNDLGTFIKKIYEINLRIIFYPPDLRKRDIDNLQARVKYLIDGACLAFNCDDRLVKKIESQSRIPGVKQQKKRDGGYVDVFFIINGEC